MPPKKKLPVLQFEEKADTKPTHSIRVGDDEWDAWAAHAAANNMSTSEWVRRACARETQRGAEK